MAAPWQLLTLAALLARAAAEPSVLVSSQQGLLHLRVDGGLISWRNETLWDPHSAWNKWLFRPPGALAVNPRNGTVCWPSSEGYWKPAVVRCAAAEDLNNSWDLPLPKSLGLSVPVVDALALDWVTGNWHLTASRTNYVCSDNLDRCLKVGQTGRDHHTGFYVKYDIPNRLVFMLAIDEGLKPFRMERMRLDGSDRRTIYTESAYTQFPAGLGVDSVDQQVYWLAFLNSSVFSASFSAGNLVNVREVGQFSRMGRRYDVSVAGNSVFVMQQEIIRRIDKATGAETIIANGTVEGATQPELQKLEELLAVKAFSNETQPEVENLCAVDNGGCRDFCVPTVVDGTASRTCFCEEGYELAGVTCRKSLPAVVMLVHQDTLQALDLDSGTSSTILSGLTDATRLDFFWTGEEYLLFWLDDGGLFRGSWTPGGQVEDVQELTPAGQAKRATDVAVEWRQRNVFWIEKDGDQMRLKVTNLNGTAIGTIYSDQWRNQQALITQTEGMHIAFTQIPDYQDYPDLGSPTVKMVNMTGAEDSFFDLVEDFDGDLTPQLNWGLRGFQPTEWASDLSLTSSPWHNRYFWIALVPSRETNSRDIEIAYASYDFLSSGESFHPDNSGILKRARLLTHPSLSNTGGLDVLGDRIFWADNNAKQLMTANSETGGDVHAVDGAGGLSAVRAVRVLHPRKQPPTRYPVCDQTSNGCSDMCQLVRDGYPQELHRAGKCTCGDGRSLGEDQKTCE